MISILFGTSAVYAEFGLIQDPDGIVNVRQTDSLKSKVIAQLKNGTVVSCSYEQGDPNFCYSNFSIDNQINSGFIHKSRINAFKDFQKWRLTKRTSNQAEYSFGNNNLKIAVQNANAKVLDFKIEKDSKSDDILQKFKNRPFFGTDHTIPNTKQHLQIVKVDIHYQNKAMVISAKRLEPYFLPNQPLEKGGLQDFEMAEIYSKGPDLYILNSLANGGAAQYSLIIHIQNGALKELDAWNESL